MAQFEGGYLTNQGAGVENEGWQSSNLKAQESNTIRSITIAQLHKGVASGDPPVDILKIDDVEASHLILCGQILSIDKQVSSIHYRISDGTGEILVKNYTPKNEDLAQLQNEDDTLMEGIWCMVYGHYRSMERDYFINAFRIRPITDPNEITFHFTSCIHQYLHFTRGPLPDEGQDSKMGRYSMGGDVVPPQPTYPQQPSSYPHPGAAPRSKPDIFARLGDLLQHSRSPDMHYDEICQALGSDFDPTEVQRALNTLVNEGRAYTSTADDRFTWSS